MLELIVKNYKRKNCKLFMEHLGSGDLLSHRDAIKFLKENGLVCKKKGNQRKVGENYYIFEKNNRFIKKSINKNIIEKITYKLIDIFKLRKTINYFHEVFLNIIDELLFLLSRFRDKKIKNKYKFKNIENIYKINKWNDLSMNEEFLNKLK